MDVSKPMSHGARIASHGNYISRFTRTQAGITLVELLSTIAVFSIIVSFSIPSLKQVQASNRLTGHINKLRGYLAYTRTEAIKRGSRVTICQSNFGQECSGSANWKNGWILFIDQNNNKQRDNAESIITYQPKLADGVDIIFNGSGANDSYIFYKPDGSSYPNGSFTLCSTSEPPIKKTMIISLSGRVRISQQTAMGNKINC